MTNPFDYISEKNKEKLLRSLDADILHFNENTNIPQSIIDNNSIGIVVNGYIQITRINYNGNNVLIEELQENEVFGSSVSYLKSGDYIATAKEDTKLIIVDLNSIINFKENSKSYYNQFIKNLFLILNEKMQIKNQRIQILTRRTIRNKLLEYFVVASKGTGSKNVYLPFSFTALADYLAVDRSALSREIKYLKDEGFIDVKGKRITLLYK